MAAPRSTRKRIQYAEDDQDSVRSIDENASEDDSEAAPAPKRRKQGGGKRTREKKSVDKKQQKKKTTEGSLTLVDMPLDVLLEIFALIHPLDILHLSRTNKALRGTLMSRTSAFLWKAAISNLGKLDGLPPCPPDLTEPQYVRLMFEWKCTFCNAPTIDFGQWVLRVRCCRTCIKKELVQQSSAESMLDYVFWRRTLPLDRIATSIHGRDNKMLSNLETYYLKSDIISLRRKLDEMTVRECGENENGKWSSTRLQMDKLRDFARERSGEVTLAIMHAAEMQGYQRYEREVDAIRDQRKQDILDKLRQLGYTEELRKMSMSDFEKHPLVKPAKALTDRAWAGMKDNMIQFMEDVKAKRLA